MDKGRGFTLVELLIAIMLTMAVLSAGYSVYYGSSKAATMQTQLSRMQDNARMAMDVLARNFRRAGFDVRFSNYPTGTVIRPANLVYDGFTSEKLVHENADDAPDAVTIVGGWPGWKTHLKNTAPIQSVDLTLADASMIQPGDVIGIGLTHTARVGAMAGTVLTLDDSRPLARLNMTYYGELNVSGSPDLGPDGIPRQKDMLVRVEANRFDIVVEDGVPILRQDGQPVAEGIEDLQIEYGVDANEDKMIDAAEWTHTPDQFPFGGAISDMRDWVRLVRITIVARTGKEDPALVGTTRTVPAIGDREAWETADGYRRLILTRVVECRNMGAFQAL